MTLALTLLLTLSAQPGASLDAGVGERRVALVVGNGAYDETPLNNAVGDARLVAGALRRVGFEVIEVHNANRRVFARALQAFGDALEEDAVGLFYFSGHGLQHEGRNYLVPTGALITTERDIELEAIDASRALAEMEETGARIKLMILDACRNNPIRAAERSMGGGLAAVDAPRGTLLVYATAPGRTATDGRGEHSPFSLALAEEVLVPGQKVEDVLKRVRFRVDEESGGRQLPWQSSSLLGDFYFVPPGQQPLPASAAKASPAAQETTEALGDDEEWVYEDEWVDEGDDGSSGTSRGFELPKLIPRAYLYTSGGLALVGAGGALLMCCAPIAYACSIPVGILIGLVVQAFGSSMMVSTIAVFASAALVGGLSLQAIVGAVAFVFGICSAPSCLIAGFTHQYFWFQREEELPSRPSPSAMRF